MADIKQIQVGGTTYNLKDEAAREALEGKQDVINSVTASIDSNAGTPSVVPSWNNGTLDFAFHNIQGPKGDTVILGDEEEYTLYNTTGNNTDGAMTQKSITEQLNYVISLIPMIDVDEDGFFVVDENYNIGFGVTGSGVVGFKNVGYK